MSTQSGRMVQHPVGPAARSLLILAVVAGVLLLDACGGGSSSGASTEGDDGELGREDDARARADDQEALRADIEDLLADYDRVVNQIIADPGVVADRDGLLAQEYLDLFEPESRFAEDVLASWEANGEAGVSMHPYDAEHATNETRLDGEIEVESDDEVVVPVCIEQRYVVHEGGRVTEGVPYMEQPGEVVAVRVDGEWLIRRRDVFDNVTECATAGGEGGG